MGNRPACPWFQRESNVCLLSMFTRQMSLEKMVQNGGLTVLLLTTCPEIKRPKENYLSMGRKGQACLGLPRNMSISHWEEQGPEGKNKSCDETNKHFPRV